jgi:hypothetical protein
MDMIDTIVWLMQNKVLSRGARASVANEQCCKEQYSGNKKRIVEISTILI